MIAVIAYIFGTLLMAFGWLCGLARGDASPQEPRISGMVCIFAVALALLTVPGVRLWRAGRGPLVPLMVVISIQALSCVYVIAVEFTL